MSIYTPFISVEDQNEWMGKSTEPVKQYIEKLYLSSAFGNDVHDPMGGVLLRGGGFVDAPNFVECVRQLLKSNGLFYEERFDDGDLAVAPVAYKRWDAKRIVFCRGIDELSHRYFSWLPIRPLKGETLTIRTETLERIYNRGVYIVPRREAGVFQVGATYDREGSPGITKEGRQELVSGLNNLIRKPYEIIDQNWGMRPTTPDRRPLLGQHPEYKNVFIFNGLGTKGVILAPYFSGQLVAWMEREGEFIKEVNISRYKSLYSRF